MKLIVDFLRRFSQRGRPETKAYAARMSETGDRSSMADFVRILQTIDQDHVPSNPSN
jgi:hypothetical protein